MAYNDRALCRCGIRIPSARNRCLAFDKDKYLEPMFGDVGQARTKAAMLLLPIDTTSSRTCTKPNVIRLCFYQINLRVQLVEEIILFLFVGFGVFEFYNVSICKTH